MNGTLTRFAYAPECTLGWLQFGTLRLATIERPWIANPVGPGGLPQQSCVPDGTYNARPHTSVRFPNTFALTNHALGVYYQPGDKPAGQPWGRTAILIHAGNRVRDVIGCVAVGMRHGWMLGEHAVLDSQVALARLRDVLGRDFHQLNISPTLGTQEAA